MSDPKPRLAITYCTQCRWLLRAAWMAQEVLSTFPEDFASVSLVPGRNGVFTIRLNEDLIWDRTVNDGFPEAKVLKQIIRDRIDPDRSLGHCDVEPQAGKQLG